MLGPRSARSGQLICNMIYGLNRDICLMSECNEALISAPSRKSVVAKYSMVFSIVCGYAAQSINFVPSNSVTYIAIAAAISLSLMQVFSIQKPNNVNAVHNLRHVGLFLILCLSNVWMFAITLPSFASPLHASELREVRAVLDANKSSSPFKCHFSVILENLSAPLKSKTCVSQSDWDRVKKGDRVTVVLMSSEFGQAAKRLESTGPEAH